MRNVLIDDRTVQALIDQAKTLRAWSRAGGGGSDYLLGRTEGIELTLNALGLADIKTVPSDQGRETNRLLP